MSNKNRGWVVSTEQKCEGLQNDKHIRSDRKIWCCCFTVVIQKGKEMKVKRGVHPEFPMRPERKSVVLCILHNTTFLRFESLNNSAVIHISLLYFCDQPHIGYCY